MNFNKSNKIQKSTLISQQWEYILETFSWF